MSDAIHLFDRLLAEGVVEPKGYDKETSTLMMGQPQRVRPDLTEHRFLVDEASDFYFMQERGDWDAEKDFLCVRPPFDITWFESRAPKTVWNPKLGRFMAWTEFWPNGPTQYGVLMRCHHRDSEAAREWVEHANSAKPVGDYEWLVISTVFVHLPKNKGNAECIFNPGTFAHFAGADGAIVPQRADGETARHWSWLCELEGLGSFKLADFALAFVDAVLLSLTFMACVNVPSDEVKTPPAKLAKAFARRHRGQRLSTFKVLRLEPHAPRSHREGHGGTGPGKRLHVVRGHFRRMPPSGKDGRVYTKRLFWVRPHVRGDKEYGEVTKDYEVLPGDFAK